MSSNIPISRLERFFFLAESLVRYLCFLSFFRRRYILALLRVLLNPFSFPLGKEFFEFLLVLSNLVLVL